MTPADLALVALIGLLAGSLGGLAGVGGSMIIIPGLVLLLGDGGAPGPTLHLIMAVAMTSNFMVALPAALRHAKAGAVRTDLMRVLVPSMVVTIIAGVLISNATPTEWLRRMLAAFIAAYAILNMARAVRRRPEAGADQQRIGWPLLAANGGVSGLVSGLLGLGGGVVLVPLLQVVNRVPLRQSIATALAVIACTSVIGAGVKLGTLHTHGQSLAQAATLIVLMAPSALLGGHLGATLTHVLPLTAVRVAISALLVLIAAKLAGLI